MLILSSSIYAFVMYIAYISSGFTTFIFINIIFAIRHTLYSGTINAIIYDTLDELGRKIEFEKIIGKGKLITMITTAIGGSIGARVATYNIRLPLLMTVISAF